jgi:hypothetical protein
MARSLLRSHARRGALSYGLVAGALVLLAPSAGIAVDTNVVTCSPSAGGAPTVKLSPPLVPPPGSAKYGYKLATTIDGCAANAQQLGNWDDVKRGTPDGARIKQAEVSLGLTGVDNCALGLISQIPHAADAYPAVGKLQLKWLDANGDKIKSAKTTTAFIHLLPLTEAINFSPSSYGEGVVTSGLGVGARVQVNLPVPMSFLTDEHGDFAACIIGGITVPGFPPTAGTPLKAIPLSARPSVNIVFPDPNPS